MKLSLPRLQISEDEGFSDEKDIFKRKSFGEALLNLVTKINDEMVIAIDSPWGEGKTTFIQMWRGTLKANDIPSIYFDAFANDYIDDPFVALSGEIYELAKRLNAPDEKIKAYKEKAIKAGKIILKSSAKIGIKALTLGVLDGSELEEIGIGKDIASEASNLSEKYVSSLLESYEEDKQCFSKFRQAITELAENTTTENKPLVFIVDELDRCRPIFAIELLEKIKHIFSIPKIVFVLVMNREQLEESIKSQYGAGINSTQYLQKFINVWSNLPKNNDSYSNDSKIYFKHLMKQHEFPISSQSEHAVIEFMIDYLNYFKLTLREIEQAVINMMMVRISYNFKDNDNILVPILAVIKVKYPSIFRKLQNSEINYESLVSELNLLALANSYDCSYLEGKEERHVATWLMRYCLTSDEKLTEMPQDYFANIGLSVSGHYRKQIIPSICKTMSAIHITN